MPEQHGGYRRPSNPAPVSGPGAHSARTDTGPKHYQISGGSYGSTQDFQQQQSSAPLAPQSGAPGSTAPAGPPLTPLSAPSGMPTQPVTAGADAGAGPSMADIGIAPQETDAELKTRLGPLLPTLMRMADSQYATDAFRQQVRELQARIG
jgi:hypothetical protein